VVGMFLLEPSSFSFVTRPTKFCLRVVRKHVGTMERFCRANALELGSPASTLGSAIYCSYVRAYGRIERTPSGGGEPGPGFLSCAHVRQTHQRRVSGDIGPIAQHGIDNLSGMGVPWFA
jgi:hypothetical protein